MAGPKGKGVASGPGHRDASSTPPSNAPSSGAPGAEPADDGIADDANLFSTFNEESTGKARSLDSDWLYKLDGQVFGPVKPRELLELLYNGDIKSDTPISATEGDFAPLERYGVFRVHLPKVEQRRKEREAAAAAEAAAAKMRLRRRMAWFGMAVTAAVVLTIGLVSFVRHRREAEARREARAKEEALLREVEDLMARVTIQPALVGLVDDEEAKEPADGKGSKKRGRKVGARPTSGGVGEVIGAGGTGELTRSEIMAGVAKVLPNFKRCIVEQIQRDSESVSERIVVAFSVSYEGVVQNIEIGDRVLRQSPLQGCMVKALGELRFRKYKGEIQNIEYPILIGRR